MITTTLLLAFLAQFQQDQISGLVLVPRGQTEFGMEVKTAESLIKEHPGVANSIGGCMPRNRVFVEAFFVGSTEVTNEMYQRFVDATGAQPPSGWVEVSADLNRALLEWGKAEYGPQWVFTALEKSRWWDSVWKEKQWRDFTLEVSLAPDRALEPVVFVNHRDALAYCRWAGLRLLREEEWVRVSRGDEKREYAYGNTFDASLTSFNDTRPQNLAYTLLPVNAFPKNASPFGIVDLPGNVWEWTSSPYIELDGFKVLSVKTEVGVRETLPPFDPSRPVIKGGSFQNPGFVSMVDMRMGIDPAFRAEHVGFRVAASVTPCRDIIEFAGNDVKAKVLGGTALRTLDYDRVIGLEKRYYAQIEEIAARRSKPKNGLPETSPPDSYAVFDGYDCLAITPVAKLDFGNTRALSRDVEKKGPIPVAILHSSVALQEPSLQAGTYTLVYLPEIGSSQEVLDIGAMLPPDLAERLEEEEGDKPKETPKEEKDTAEEEVAQDPNAEEEVNRWPDLTGVMLRPRKEYLLVVDNDLKALGAITLKRQPLYVTEKKEPPQLTVNLNTDSIDFRLPVPAKSRGRAFLFQIPLKPHGPEGSLVKENYWDGSYYNVQQVIEEE